jgi:signal transduction histidine kinase
MIRDNGSGFKETPSAHRGHGLNNMQARAQQVGAELRIDSEPGDGTRVVMTIPINSCP